MSTITSRTRTITVRLPEALADEIETKLRKRGVSKSDVVDRERLEPLSPEEQAEASASDLGEAHLGTAARPR